MCLIFGVNGKDIDLSRIKKNISCEPVGCPQLNLRGTPF